jgi:hypothetical protein
MSSLMMLPAWLWIGTPVKLWLWVSNRVATWIGLFCFWRQFRSRRGLWVWALLLNAVSLGILGVLFFWLSKQLGN